MGLLHASVSKDSIGEYYVFEKGYVYCTTANNYPLHTFILLFLVPVKLRTVTLTTSVNQHSASDRRGVVLMHCNPIMEGITDPSTITVEIEWWVGGGEQGNNTSKKPNDFQTQRRMVFHENFRLSAKTFSTLDRQYWTIGQTVLFLMILI